jgi:phosphopantetheinyl transferase (holo-ACP synthase)
VSVGNDVVDLADPECRLERLHPRFDERVFSPAERAALGAAPWRPTLHWAFWAAKESAYKACKRLDAAAVFSPREFAVELSGAAPTVGVASGRVVHRGQVLSLEVTLADAYVHAVARSEGSDRARVISGVGPVSRDPSRDVRCLAALAIGTALGLDCGELSLAGRLPLALRGDRPIATVSLSHHGRFVAFAFRLADPGSSMEQPGRHGRS